MILPPATLGMLGGGQLGRFFVIAAHELGYRVVVLDPDAQSPAGRIADQHLVAAYDDPDALNRMAESCAAVTTEFEHVPAGSLAYLSKFLPVRPGAEAVAISQNRSAEKGFLKQHGFPHAPYADVRAEADIAQANAGLFPGILKVARFGYDGKGQVRVATRAEALLAFRQLKNEPCVLEQMLPLDYEVSVVLSRDEERVYVTPPETPFDWRFWRRNDAPFMYDEPSEDCHVNGCTPVMRRPVGPRFGARKVSRWSPRVPMYVMPPFHILKRSRL